MPVRAHELSDGGVVLVDSVTGLPLPVSVRRFETAEHAEWFLASLPCDARLLMPEELQKLVVTQRFRLVPDASDEPGSVCGEYPAVTK